MNNHPFRALEYLHPRSLARLSYHLADMVQGRLWLKVLIGMALGLGAGVVLGPSMGLVDPALGVTIGNWLAFPGRLFLATIQMIVIPLVVASVIRDWPPVKISSSSRNWASGLPCFLLPPPRWRQSSAWVSRA